MGVLPLPQNGRATGVQLTAIATQRVSGWTIHELAERWGYTYDGMKGLLQSEKMAALLETQHAKIEQGGARALAVFMDNSELLAKKMVGWAKEPGGDHEFEATKYVLDAILPKRQQQVTETNVVVNQQTNNVLMQIGEGFQTLAHLVKEQTTGGVKTPNGSGAEVEDFIMSDTELEAEPVTPSAPDDAVTGPDDEVPQ